MTTVYAENVLGYIPPPNPSPIPVTYVNNTTGIVYPNSNFITTLGPVYLPSIYASNLSALEFGSSGTMQYTLFDIHSLDLTRDANSNIIFNVCNSNESLVFALSNPDSTAYIKLDGSNGNNDITLSAACNIFLNAGKLTQNITNTLAFNTGCNFSIGASNNITQTANSNMYFTASQGTFSISAVNGTNTFVMDTDTGNATWASTSNIYISSSNHFVQLANSNATFTALQQMALQSTHDSFSISAFEGSNTTLMNNVGTTMSTQGVMSMNTSNAFNVVANSNISLTATEEDVTVVAGQKILLTAQNDSFELSATNGTNTLVMDNVSGTATWASTSNMYINSSNSIFETANSNISITALQQMALTSASNSFTLSAYAGSNQVAMDDTGVRVQTLSNMTFGASNVFSATANSNMDLTATVSNITITAGKAIDMSAQNDRFTVNAASGTSTFTMDSVAATWASQNNVRIYTSNSFVQQATGNASFQSGQQMTLTSVESNMKLSAWQGSNIIQLDDAGTAVTTRGTMVLGTSNLLSVTANSNVQVTATANNLSLTAGQQVNVTAQSSSYSLSAFAGSNILYMDANGTKMQTRSNMTLGTSNLFKVTANSNVDIEATVDDVSITAGQQILLTAQNNTFKVSATNGTNEFVMDNATGTATWASTSNMYVSSSNSFIQFANSNVSLSAGEQMDLVATNSYFALSAFAGSNIVKMDSDGTVMFTKSNMTFGTSNDLDVTAQTNASITAVANNLSMTAGQEILMTAQNNSFALSATNGTNTFVMDNASGTASWASTSNIYISSSNDLVQLANSNVNVTALEQMSLTSTNSAFSVSAFLGSNTVSMDDTGIKMQTLSNMVLGTSNALAVTANSNISLVATVSNVSITAGQKISMSAQSNSFTLNAYANSNTVAMDNTGVKVHTMSNMVLGTSNAMLVTANSNISLTATTNDVTLSAGKNITMTANTESFSLSATNGTNQLSMDSATGNAAWSTTANMYINSSNQMFVKATNLHQVETIDAEIVGTTTAQLKNSLVNPTQFLKLDHTSLNTTLSNSEGSIYVGTTGSIYEYAGQSKTTTIGANSVETVAGNKNIFITGSSYFGSTDHAIYTTNATMKLTASNSMNLSSLNQSINITASNQTRLDETATGGAINISAPTTNSLINYHVGNAGTHQFFIGETPLMQLQTDTVIINANLQVQGVIDSINVSQTNLFIQDKELYLAYGSNTTSNITDGITNTGAGIIIPGCGQSNTTTGKINVPTDNASNVSVYEKSFKWNFGDPSGLGIFTQSATTESYWEIKGGSLKITNMNPTAWDASANVTASNPVSFTLRINTLGELEIVKFYSPTPGAATINTVVAKFGRTLNI
jgi:uncharacterized protein (DUF2345 family)